MKRLGWIGDLPVSKIAREDVVFFIAELQEDGYAPSTVSEMLSMVRCGLACAVEEGIIDRDVSARIKAPKRGALKPRSLSDDEKFRVLRLCEPMQGFLPVAIRLALSTGMRRGELCGLRWSAVDLDLEFIRVVSSIGQVGHGRFVEKEPKTSASRRRLPIEPGLLDVLRDRRESQERECEKSHIRFSEDMFVLGTPDGRWLNPDTLHRRFAEFSKAFSVAGGKCRLHWLRHTFATSMISHGVDVRTVAAWLGHSDPGFTLRTYVDLDERAMRDSVAILAASLVPPPAPTPSGLRAAGQGKIISWSSINAARSSRGTDARFPRCP